MHKELGPAWIENRPARGWLSRFDAREVWDHRELALFLALRDLQLRYRQTVFGVAWAILQPVVGAGIFTLVFAGVGRLDAGEIPYLVFAFAGMVIWTYVSSSVDAAARSLIEDRALVERVYFPRMLLPVATVLPGLLDVGISLVILALLMATLSVAVPVTVVLLPLWFAAAALVALAAGLWLAALNVQYRDVRYALTFGLQVWFYASPVVYPSSLLDGAARWIYSINPLVGVIDGFRWSAFGGAAPPPQDVVSGVVGVLLLGSGIAYFHGVERRFADVI